MKDILLAIPFLGILLSLGLGPLFLEKSWHLYFFKMICGWIFLCLTFLFYWVDSSIVFQALFHTLIHDYFPFIVLVGALFTITSHIHLQFYGKSTPFLNTLLLAIGGILTNLIGTTGAAMLLIRPFIDFNKHRCQKAHLIIFFIFIVANIGGSLTPLGDPPLFIGYLKGVSFLWPLSHLFLPWCFIILPLLGIFYGIDAYFLAKEGGGKGKEKG